VRLSTIDAAHAAGASAYNPAATFELTVNEVELRRNSAGRMLMARIYQPKGPGPFPTVLDLHGGAWNGKNRLAEEPMDRALGGEWAPGGRHRHDAGARRALSGLRAGRQLRPCAG